MAPKKTDTFEAYWIIGEQMASAVKVPRVSTKLVFKDIAGSWKARWGINRMNYKVNPGLYCIYIGGFNIRCCQYIC